MAMIVVHHMVGDLEKWKEAFSKSEDLRREYGIRGGHVCYDALDCNKLTVILECEDLERARDFFDNDEIKRLIKEAAVVGEMQILYLQEMLCVSETVTEDYGTPSEAVPI